MNLTKPTPDLLRSLSDEHVLQALMHERQLTRAELATRTGLSKPTVSDSVRRLTDAGLVRDTGERTTGRGRVGTYYGLADDLGVALVVDISPAGVVAETVDIYGDLVAREREEIARPARPTQVEHALTTVVSRAQDHDPTPARVTVVSAADPVDRATGRLVHLPDAPFLVGELSPADVLAPLVAGPVTVDNDVHWAARAERRAATDETLDDFVYLYLGAGLGCALVSDGEVRRGHAGIAGEIAHVVTRGAKGRAVAFTEIFAELGLREPDSTAIDASALLRAVEGDDARALGVRTALADAISDVSGALIALADPQLLVVGGTWGPAPTVLRAVSDALACMPRQVPVRAAVVTDEASLRGARHRALDELRSAIQSLRSEASSRSA